MGVLNKNNLPTYSIVFDEDEFESGIDFIAITETPAIEELSIRLSKQEDKTIKFTKDEEKRLVLGPAIIPDTPIYRNDNGNEYYVVFTRETIERMVEKFNNEQRSIMFNVEHNEDLQIEGFIKESWIIEDPDMDKSKLYGFDLPVGTWMLSAKFPEDVWNDVIKQFKNIGFSIEGLMGIQQIKLNKNQNNMTKKGKQGMKNGKAQRKNKFFVNKIYIKRRFNALTKKFEDVLVDNEEEVLIIEDLEEGAEVETVNEEGEVVEAEDGTYEIPSEDIVIEVEDGEIVDIQESEEEEEFAEEEEEEKEEKEKEKEEMADEEVLAKIVELETRLEAVEALLAEVHDEEGEVEEFSRKRSRRSKKKTRFSKDAQKAERLAILARLLK